VDDVSRHQKGSWPVQDLLIAVTVVCALVLVTTGAVAYVAVRSVRRRYRAARERVRSVRVPTAPVAVATVSSPTWWTVQHRRHRMWRAVSSAEHAVAVARRSDVPVGDLPALTAQLSSAARGVDAVLRAGAHGTALRPEDRAACDRVVEAAGDIHRAALSSLRFAQADTDPLLTAVQIEVAALAAGVRAATR
jgi:hypothetical protein